MIFFSDGVFQYFGAHLYKAYSDEIIYSPYKNFRFVEKKTFFVSTWIKTHFGRIDDGCLQISLENGSLQLTMC